MSDMTCDVDILPCRFVISQPIFKFSMSLEPHCNVDSKTGAGSTFSSKNAWVMAK